VHANHAKAKELFGDNMSEVEQMIQDCINRKSKLNEWEQNFIHDLQRKYKVMNATAMQIAKLNEIWDRIT